MMRPAGSGFPGPEWRPRRELHAAGIFDEEYFRARAPILPGRVPSNLLGPTLISCGTEEQKKRHLPRILTGEERWCQGYSEPGAGSDLASLQDARGRRTATISSSTGRRCGPRARSSPNDVLLVRTDPDAPKHTASATCWST